jgi:arsenate reductase
MGKATNKVKVLFLCTGNSCRSQLAEGWARHLKGDVIDAYSAGVLPVGVHPRAVAVMKEAGVDISKQTSKHVNLFLDDDFDYVVTLCDNAREQCPVFPGRVKFVHHSFEDPSFVFGTEEEIMQAFRKTRDMIRTFVETLPDSLEGARKARTAREA